MTTASAVPAAFRAVVSGLTANLPAGAEVIVGPGATDTGAQMYVFVGANDPNADGVEDAVTGVQTWAQLGGMRRDEDFTIHCCAVAWNGDGDQLKAMDDAFSLLGASVTAIVGDPTMAGSVLYAKGVESLGVRFLNDSDGAAAYLPFDIACRSRI